MNKKIKYYLLQFYAQPFIAFFIVFGIVIYVNSLKHFMHHAGLLIFAVLFLTFLFGTARLLVDRFLFPSEFDKLVDRKPFSSFINRGFVVGNGYLKGKIYDYEVLLGYSMKNNRIWRRLYANIVFKPERDGKFLTEKEISELNKKYKDHNFSLSYNSLDIEWSFEGKPPHFRDIWTQIKDGIAILKKEDLQPSTLAESYNVEKEIWDTLLESSK